MGLIANVVLWFLFVYTLFRPNIWSSYLLLLMISLTTLIFNGLVALIVLWLIALFFSILVTACIQMYRKYK